MFCSPGHPWQYHSYAVPTNGVCIPEPFLKYLPTNPGSMPVQEPLEFTTGMESIRITMEDHICFLIL